VDQYKKKDDEDNTEIVSGSISGEKSQLLLSAVHNEADWITFRVFMMAILLMIILQAFAFFVRKIGEIDIKKAVTDTDGYFENMAESGNQLKGAFSGFMGKMMDDKDRTFTNLLVNNDTLGNDMIFDIFYNFAMSFTMMIQSFVLMYGFNYLYVYFVVKDDEYVTEDALHMHVDIMMFASFIILMVLLIYLAMGLSK